ncbi:MAG TPA: hypothetical protein VFY67_05055 [Pyrinomonadaceae bacterium]|nr:hypothetical protein [Pyrinomonadaceae bacterium]
MSRGVAKRRWRGRTYVVILSALVKDRQLVQGTEGNGTPEERTR